MNSVLQILAIVIWILALLIWGAIAGSVLSQWYHRRKKYRRTLQELSSLTDYELKDIGLTRGDIHRVAKGELR